MPTKINRALEAELSKLAGDRVKEINFKIAASKGVTYASIHKVTAELMCANKRERAFDRIDKIWYEADEFPDYVARGKGVVVGSENLGMKAAQAEKTGLELPSEITLRIVYDDKLPKKD